MAQLPLFQLSSLLFPAACPITTGATWVLNRERFNSFAPRVNVGLLQTLLDDA